MSDEKTTNKENVTPSQEDEKKGDVKMVPLSALHEERDKRKALEAEILVFKTEKERKDEEDLGWKEKFEKRDREFNELQASHKQDRLRSKALAALTELKFPTKLATALINSQTLDDSNVDKVVKNLAKEYEEFIPKNSADTVLAPTATAVASEKIYDVNEAAYKAANEIFKK